MPAAPHAPTATRPGWRAIAAWVLLCGFTALFFAVPVAELQHYPRAQFFGLMALLADQTVGAWFGDPREFAVGDRLRVALPAVAIVAICGLAGRLALSALRIDRRLTRFDTIFFSCTVGLGLLSLYTFGVGVCGGLHLRGLFLIPAAAIVLAGLYRLRSGAGQSAKNLAATGETRESSPAENARARRWLWWAVPFVVVIVLGGTLTPLDFDVREYHLQVPKEFYLQGSIGFLPHNVYGNMPLGSEMFSLAAMALSGDWFYGALIGKTVIALCAPLAALGVFAAGRRLIGPVAGAVAALVYISIPWIARVSALGLVEGVSALYLWGTAYALILWWRSADEESLDPFAARSEPAGARRERELPSGAARSAADSARDSFGLVTLCGFLAGSAVACKYPNVIFVLIPAAGAVALRSWRRATTSAARPLSKLLPGGCFVLAAAVACGPWLAKNWALTGNPTYPLLYQLFDGRTRTPALDAQWTRAHRPPGYTPWHVADAVANVAWRSAWLSPLLLPLAILGMIDARDRRLALSLGAYALFVFSAWWLFTHRIDRFWIPISPVLAFLGGYVVQRDALLPRRWPQSAYLSAGLVFNLLFIVSVGGGDTAYFVSIDSLNHDSKRIHDWHQFLNRHLDDRDRVLTVGDALVFDLTVPVFYNTVFDADRFEQLMKGRTTDERRQALSDLGVTYVAVDWAEIARYRSPGNYGFTDYIQPELFEVLVRQEVLDPPLHPEGADPNARFQIFPVHGASTRANEIGID